MGILKAFKPFVGDIFGTIDKLVLDKDLALKLKNEVKSKSMDVEDKLISMQAKLIATEMQGSDAQKNWRPHLMYLLMFIVANNYMIAPYVSVMFGIEVHAVMDDNIWDLMKIGVGGYVFGRSAEKVALNLKK